jgi:homoserine kinase
MTTVRVPASTANLGPAFDCLGLALDLWNETTFELSGNTINIDVSGEGQDTLPRNDRNLVLRAFARLYQEAGKKPPIGVALHARQEIPLSSGLGSSAAASLTGLLAANSLLGDPLRREDILQLGAEIEGHADNLAAALYGGLVLVTQDGSRFFAEKLECAQLIAVVVLPEIKLSTRDARKALPAEVPMKDAIFNIGHGIQVVDAMRTGDIQALAAAMDDRLHQPHRLPLIPGAAEALQTARKAGAAAALSGAGPSLIAFIEEGREKAITETMRAPFAEKGVKTRQYLLKNSEEGARVEVKA